MLMDESFAHDQKQREYALDPSQSFIVQAPAGSGKTELLIQRFLTLLAKVNRPEEILAITFTKKAANEMRERILHALKSSLFDAKHQSDHQKKTWILAKNVLDHDAKLKWNLIKNPNQLRILTIDAFCVYLTKQLPLLSHFGAAPDIAEQPDYLYREAILNVLLHLEESVEWSDAISKLLLHLNNDLNKLHDLLVNLLKRRDQWLPYIHLDTNDIAIKKVLEHYLQIVISNHLSILSKTFPKNLMKMLVRISRFAANNLKSLKITSQVLACLDLQDAPRAHADDLAIWLGFATILLTKSMNFRKRVDKEIGFPALSSIKNPEEKAIHEEYRDQLTRLIQALSDHTELKNLLTELFFLPHPQFELQQWDILKSLLSILKITAAELRLSFQQHKQIDYIENTQAAKIALGDQEHPTDLALALDYQIRHMMIDEFQDTSLTQYQLLEKLILGWEPSDGRTLFIVGDPMQSIYRFREAEVGLFIRMQKNGIGSLSVNFRSEPAIVDWNNQYFPHIFPNFNQIATGAVSYSPSISPIKKSKDAPSSLSVEVKGWLQSDNHLSTHYLVTLIQNLKKNYPNERIAILVRSRTHLTNIMEALKKANVTYRAVDIDPLLSRQCIQDVLSLTCALLHPSDRISWLSILRAPWCGLSLADLLALANFSSYDSIWERLIDLENNTSISDDGRKRLQKMVSILQEKLINRERYSLRIMIESAWILLGGPACLENKSDLNDVQTYFSLLDEFAHHPNFNLEKLKEKMNKLYATPLDDQSLQIMTIHSAKGLEFDTVILPHLERKSANDDKSLLLWMEQPLNDDQTALLIAPLNATGNDKDVIYEYIHRQQKIKSDYERDRLLYVATTRAVKRLHLFYSVDKNEQGKFKIESSSFLEKLWPFIAKEQENQLQLEGKKEELNLETSPSRWISRLPTHWQHPFVFLDASLEIKHQTHEGFLLQDDAPKAIGTVIHRILYHLSTLKESWWKIKSAKMQSHYIQFQLKQMGLSFQQIASSIELVSKSIHHLLQDERGQWILHHHLDAKSEYAITANINQQIVNLVIDRTFIDEHGVRWIIDYKTSMFTPSDVNHFMENEKKKYVEKMNQYAEALRSIDDRPIRFGLYFPCIPAWFEW